MMNSETTTTTVSTEWKSLLVRTPAEAERMRLRLQARRRRARSKREERLKRMKREFVDLSVVYDQHEGKCGVCGDAVPFDQAIFDHIIPVSKGGEHTEANLQPTHVLCNALKSDRSQEWAKKYVERLRECCTWNDFFPSKSVRLSKPKTLPETTTQKPRQLFLW